MSRKHSDSAYPFRRTDNSLESEDGWIDYSLGPDGWYVRKEGHDGGLIGEGPRTVVQVARETEETEIVIAMTEELLDDELVALHVRDEPTAARIRDQLAVAERAIADGNL